MQRNTRQREAILEAVQTADRPLTPGDILERARADLPAIGIATVYRAIRDLVEARLLLPVELPGRATRYERADLEHHHHFVCTHCDKVYEMAGCAYRPHRLAPRGFTVEAHDIILYGRCKTCARGKATQPRGKKPA